MGERDTQEETEKKKAYLGSYRAAKRREADIEEEIQQLRMDKMLPGMRMDSGPHGSGSGDLSSYAAKLDSLIRKLDAERLASISLRTEIEERIDAMEDPEEKEVLRYRYIQGMKWEDVCEKIHYSWRKTHRLHASALKNFKLA